MAKKFRDLMSKMLPEAQADVRFRAAIELAELDLAELRGAVGLTQAEVGKLLKVSQVAVSRVESGERAILIGTLRRYVEALGGRLRVSAKFPEGEVSIKGVLAEK